MRANDHEKAVPRRMAGDVDSPDRDGRDLRTASSRNWWSCSCGKGWAGCTFSARRDSGRSSLEHAQAVAERVVKTAAGRIPIIVHVGALATDERGRAGPARRPHRRRRRFGGDAHLLPGRTRRRVRALSPHRRGQRLAAVRLSLERRQPDGAWVVREYVDRVLTLPHIAGMKVTDHDLFQLGLMQAHAGDRLILFSGADELMCHASRSAEWWVRSAASTICGARPAWRHGRLFVTCSFKAGRRFMLGFQAVLGEILARQSAWTFLRAAMRMKHGIDIGPRVLAAGYRRSSLERGRRRTADRTGRRQCTRRSLTMGLHRVLVIGVGSIGERHLRRFQATGPSRRVVRRDQRRPAAIGCGSLWNSRRARRSGDRAGRAARCGRDRDTGVLACADGDAAGRSQHSHAHRKPLSTRLDGIDRLRDLIDQRQIVAAVGYVDRVHPVLTAMKEALRRGPVRQGRADRVDERLNTSPRIALRTGASITPTVHREAEPSRTRSRT